MEILILLVLLAVPFGMAFGLVRMGNELKARRKKMVRAINEAALKDGDLSSAGIARRAEENLRRSLAKSGLFAKDD